MTRLQRRAICAAVASVLAGLGGCANDGIELNGKIFDALGVSTSSLAPRKETKMERRSPIVLPPDGKRLPEPGSARPRVRKPGQNWPKIASEEGRDAEKPNASRPSAAATATGKRRPCRTRSAPKRKAPGGNCGSLFSVFSKGLFGGQE